MISEPIYYRILVYLRARVFLRLLLFNGGGIISCTICDQKYLILELIVFIYIILMRI